MVTDTVIHSSYTFTCSKASCTEKLFITDETKNVLSLPQTHLIILGSVNSSFFESITPLLTKLLKPTFLLPVVMDNLSDKRAHFQDYLKLQQYILFEEKFVGL